MNSVFYILFICLATAYCSCNTSGNSEMRRPTGHTQYDYREYQVTFQNEHDFTKLSGTLVIPDSPQPSVAFILIPHSSLNRDATVGRHSPYQKLATHLARNGLITLRTDSRGIGQSEGTAWPLVTKLDIVSDIEAAIGYLKSRSEVDTTRIGLIGHSEGASVAAMVSGRSSDVSYVIMLAGPGLPGCRVLCSQIRLVATTFGIGNSTIERYVSLIEKSDTILHVFRDEQKVRSELVKLYDDYLHQTSVTERSELTKCGYSTPENSEQFAAGILLPWMKDFLLYDPRTDLKHVQCPILYLIGSKDMQVAVGENVDAIRQIFKQSGNRNAVVSELPGLNHMLQVASTGSPFEYQVIDEAISPLALETISKWILNQE